MTHRLSFELAQQGYEVASAKSDGCVKVVLYPAAQPKERGGRVTTLAASLD